MGTAERAPFAEYVAARHTALLRTAYLLVGNRADAEDLLQTVLARTFLRWEHIDSAGAADAYVRRAMVNTRTSLWRRRRDEYLSAAPPERPGRDEAADVDLQVALRDALGRLSHRRRAMVVLRYYEDMTEAEIAALLGLSVGTVKSTVSRALDRLRRDVGLLDDPPFASPDEVGAPS